MKNLHLRPGRIAIAALICLAAGLPAAAEGKNEAAKINAESTLSVSADIAFEDVNESASVLDWGPASGGPELRLDFLSLARFRLSGLDWLELGPNAEAVAKVGSDVVTPSAGDPYLVADNVSLRALAGWGADASFRIGAGKLKGGLVLLGGAGILDLSEADIDYLTTGAVAEDFWFRFEPCVGLEAAASFELLGLKASARNRYLFTWDSGSAYGREWSPGFEESLEARLGYGLINTKSFDLELKAAGDFSLASRLVVPVLKGSIALRADLDWRRVGKLKLTPLAYSLEEDVPDLDLAGAEDIERGLYGKLEWETKLASGTWSLSLDFPWWATEDGEATSGQWKLAIGRELGE